MLLLALGCGGDASDAGTEPAAAAAWSASVRITADRDGPDGVAARSTRLRSPSSRRERACRRLRGLPRSAFAPVPAGTACTELYGGPQTGRIRGTVGGRRVNARYSRTDGCQIARYERVAPLLRLAR